MFCIRLTMKGNCPLSTLLPPTIFPDFGGTPDRESSLGEPFLGESPLGESFLGEFSLGDSFLWESSLRKSLLRESIKRESFLGVAFRGDSSPGESLLKMFSLGESFSWGSGRGERREEKRKEAGKVSSRGRREGAFSRGAVDSKERVSTEDLEER